MDKDVVFGYGVLCDCLEKQANEQGYTLAEQEELLEKLKQSANMVRIHGLLTDSQSDSMFKKLNKKVVKALKPLTFNSGT